MSHSFDRVRNALILSAQSIRLAPGGKHMVTVAEVRSTICLLVSRRQYMSYSYVVFAVLLAVLVFLWSLSSANDTLREQGFKKLHAQCSLPCSLCLFSTKQCTQLLSRVVVMSVCAEHAQTRRFKGCWQYYVMWDQHAQQAQTNTDTYSAVTRTITLETHHQSPGVARAALRLRRLKSLWSTVPAEAVASPCCSLTVPWSSVTDRGYVTLPEEAVLSWLSPKIA